MSEFDLPPRLEKLRPAPNAARDTKELATPVTYPILKYNLSIYTKYHNLPGLI